MIFLYKKLCHHKKIFIEIMNEKIRMLNHSQKIYVIIEKIFIEIINKKIRVLNHNQSFHK